MAISGVAWLMAVVSGLSGWRQASVPIVIATFLSIVAGMSWKHHHRTTMHGRWRGRVVAASWSVLPAFLASAWSMWVFQTTPGVAVAVGVAVLCVLGLGYALGLGPTLDLWQMRVSDVDPGSPSAAPYVVKMAKQALNASDRGPTHHRVMDNLIRALTMSSLVDRSQQASEEAWRLVRDELAMAGDPYRQGALANLRNDVENALAQQTGDGRNLPNALDILAEAARRDPRLWAAWYEADGDRLALTVYQLAEYIEADDPRPRTLDDGSTVRGKIEAGTLRGKLLGQMVTRYGQAADASPPGGHRIQRVAKRELSRVEWGYTAAEYPNPDFPNSAEIAKAIDTAVRTLESALRDSPAEPALRDFVALCLVTCLIRRAELASDPASIRPGTPYQSPKRDMRNAKRLLHRRMLAQGAPFARAANYNMACILAWEQSRRGRW
ncbi:hypothetical protein [Streptomyces sp. NBC_01565]|uniref:hypothetical protein n=1 Tax=Streptomyces sp. NBC_01565 TaxID=2975881 RepID=UPI0022504724|nr:hypothetical protein [Streptomyces sp. NBC_01565]MCX4546699.1 hypothetical protein [Streptomyces sp. NBC_01565]